MSSVELERLRDAARAVLDELHPWGDRSGWTPAIADKLDALDSALAAALAVTPVPATCGFDLVSHLRHQREWSERTFGPGERTVGVLDHIRKELVEIEEDPNLGEWIDVVILALDGAWRIGASPEEIVAALVAKQAKNEAREWPDWRTAEPGKAIEHVRTPATCGPSVPASRVRALSDAARGLDAALDDGTGTEEEHCERVRKWQHRMRAANALLRDEERP